MSRPAFDSEEFLGQVLIELGHERADADDRVIHISPKALARRMDANEKRVYEAIREVEARGIIAVTRRNSATSMRFCLDDRLAAAG